MGVGGGTGIEEVLLGRKGIVNDDASDAKRFGMGEGGVDGQEGLVDHAYFVGDDDDQRKAELGGEVGDGFVVSQRREKPPCPFDNY